MRACREAWNKRETQEQRHAKRCLADLLRHMAKTPQPDSDTVDFPRR